MALKFKVGDKIKCVFNDNHTSEYVGSVGVVRSIKKGETKYPYKLSFGGGCNFGEHEIVKYVAGAPKFILKYDLDKDPIEEYATIAEVKDRINYLVKHKETNGLKLDSIVVYEIKKVHAIKVETNVVIKGI